MSAKRGPRLCVQVGARAYHVTATPKHRANLILYLRRNGFRVEKLDLVNSACSGRARLDKADTAFFRSLLEKQTIEFSPVWSECVCDFE